MATNAKKAVQSSLLDTWSRGDSILPLITDLGPVVRGGDSVDVPYKSSAFTVNASESASVAATSFTANTLTVNRPKFINQGVTQAQYNQLLNGNGNFANQLMRGASADLLNSIERDVIDYNVKSASAHYNLAASALTESHLNDMEGGFREQDGIANTAAGIFWLLSPRAQGKIKSVADFDAGARNPMEGMVGLPFLGVVNGIPAYLSNAVPGQVDALRQQVASTAVTVASNVATATVDVTDGPHGFVVGQQIFTSGMTADAGDADSPVTISAVTATTISYPLTAADGALADGVGIIYSASNMAMLCYGPWMFYAMDGVVPFEELVKRESNAGWTLQLYHHLGRQSHSGAVSILHC